jgi:hypothetical protein
MRTALSGGCWTRQSRCTLRLSVTFLPLALGAACAGEASGPSLVVGEGDPEGPIFYETRNSTRSGSGGSPNGSSGPLEGLIDNQPLPPPTITIDRACVIAEAPAQLVKQAVDIIVLLDNSGSMEEEAASVEANINLNFASVLTSSAVDYRVILISRHRSEPRSEDNEEANTSVCVQVPLSGLASCDAASEPVFTERFYQYSTKLESDDSFDVALDTYLPMFDNEEREEKFDHAPGGWSAWLRPGAKKVFLEVTDADETDVDADSVGEVFSASAFASALVTMAPEHFGTDPTHPGFVFHSIVGLAEKTPVTAAYLPDEPVTLERCGNEGDVTSAGPTYQELSRLTGGLRFPLCQFDAYDVVFQRIAEDVVLQRDVACDFDIPDAPLGLNLNLDNVAIEYSSGTRGVTQLGQARTAEVCQPNAFYIEGGRLNLCPDACTQVRSDPLAAVRVLFTCKSQIIVR